MKLSLTDQVIAEISRLLQVAIITGTDVVDNLRLIEVEVDPTQDGFVSLTDEYVERAEANIAKMIQKVESLRENNG